MLTMKKLAEQSGAVPSQIAWYIADLAESRGKQELFIRQSPQRLKILREHAIIESAVSSNRIEGVEVEKGRIGTIIFGKPTLRDRNEEEVSGYREALNLIHARGSSLPISEETILLLHRMSRGGSGDAGQLKEKNGEIIEKSSNGRSRVRFKPLSAAQTPGAIRELVRLWESGISEKAVHPMILLAAFNLDFLCIHPFRDGNGRVSRLLLLTQCYHLGIEVGRYISLERLIEQNKERYYEVLEDSSRGWHEGIHDPWPYIGFLLYILKSAYKEFEERVDKIKGPRGEKTDMAIRAIAAEAASFSVSDIQRKCPGVSLDTIRMVLKALRKRGKIECLGRGQNAKWQKTKSWDIDNTH